MKNKWKRIWILYYKNYKIIRRFGCTNWWVIETVKDEIKKQQGGFFGALLSPLAASLVQPVISSLVKGITGSWVRRAGRGYINKIFQICFIL